MNHFLLESRYYKELLKYYGRYIERVGYNPATIKMLPSLLREFFHRLEQMGIKSVEEVTPEVIDSHYRYLKERPCKGRPGSLSESMLHAHLWAIRILFSFLQAEGRIDADPFSMLTFPGPKKQQRDVLTSKEIEALYQATESTLDRVMLGLFYGCGLRKSEAVALDVKDINLRGRLLYVRSGKGKKRRVVPLTSRVAGDLKKYYYQERVMTLRKSKYPQGEKAFVLNKLGERMSGESFWRRFRHLALRSCIENPVRVTLHSLRHSIATHLLESGLSVEQVRDFLGHTSLESTQVYTRVTMKE